MPFGDDMFPLIKNHQRAVMLQRVMVWVLEIKCCKDCPGSELPNTHFLLELTVKGNSIDPQTKQIYQNFVHKCSRENRSGREGLLESQGAGLLKMKSTKKIQ